MTKYFIDFIVKSVTKTGQARSKTFLELLHTVQVDIFPFYLQFNNSLKLRLVSEARTFFFSFWEKKDIFLKMNFRDIIVTLKFKVTIISWK